MNLYEFDKNMAEHNGGCIIGTDEAGRGPLAGPVVAAAVLLDPDNIIKGIDDSKKLTEKKRDYLFDIIKKNALAYGIAEASPEEIKSLNILNASLTAMQRAIDKITKQWSCVLVDGNQKIATIDDTRQLTVVGGDAKSASIAAASILAKVTRDRLMKSYDRQYPEYGFAQHKGYPTFKHREMVKKHGLCPIHRVSFCQKLVMQIELPLF